MYLDKLFEKTQVVELLKEKFAHGEYSNYEIIFIKDGERIKPAEGTTAIFIINPNNNAIPYGNVKGDDIIKGSKVRVVITVDASETVDDARTLGHEVFLHVDRQLNRIHKILSSDVSSKEKASMIHDVFKSGNIYDPKSRALIGDLGDADHAKILNNSNRNYKEYLKELKDVIESSYIPAYNKSIENEKSNYFKQGWIRWKAKVGEYKIK